MCLADHGFAKIAGLGSLVPALSGAAIGAAGWPTLAPHLGIGDNRAVNIPTGALLGAAAGLGSREIWHAVRSVMAEKALYEDLDAMGEILKKYRKPVQVLR